MKKALIIAINNTPGIPGGDVRSRKFIKYLPFFGWKPYAVRYTIKKSSFFRLKAEMVTEQGTETIVNDEEKNPTYKGLKSIKKIIIKKIIIPTYVRNRLYHLRLFLAALEFSKQIEKDKILKNSDVIYFSIPPFIFLSRLFVILKKKTKKTCIVDFRDACQFGPYSSPSFLAIINERFILKNADRIITTTEGTKTLYTQAYPAEGGKIAVIPNGFDPANFSKKELTKPPSFTIVSTGTYSGHRNPEILFKALEELNNKKIKIVFVGPLGYIKPLAKKYDLKEQVSFVGMVKQKKAVEYMQQAHMLFLMQGYTKKPCTPIAGKTYEYLWTGNPILAVLPEGDNAEIVREYSNNSYVITSFDVNEIKKAILDCYERWQNGKTKNGLRKTNEFERKFSRKNIAKQLADLFDQVQKEHDEAN